MSSKHLAASDPWVEDVPRRLSHCFLRMDFPHRLADPNGFVPYLNNISIGCFFPRKNSMGILSAYNHEEAAGENPFRHDEGATLATEWNVQRTPWASALAGSVLDFSTGLIRIGPSIIMFINIPKETPTAVGGCLPGMGFLTGTRSRCNGMGPVAWLAKG